MSNAQRFKLNSRTILVVNHDEYSKSIRDILGNEKSKKKSNKSVIFFNNGCMTVDNILLANEKHNH